MTDVTNASRTLLFNIYKMQWDNDILRELDIPAEVLPTVRSSSEVYGHVSSGPFQGIPLAGVCAHRGSTGS